MLSFTVVIFGSTRVFRQFAWHGRLHTEKRKTQIVMMNVPAVLGGCHDAFFWDNTSLVIHPFYDVPLSDVVRPRP